MVMITDLIIPSAEGSSSTSVGSQQSARPRVAIAYPKELPGSPPHPGVFIASVLEADGEVPAGQERETFYFFEQGAAYGHRYLAPLLSPLSTYSDTRCWAVESAEQLRAWVQLEQLACGLRVAYRRQAAAAAAHGRREVPALQRLLEATVLASEQADAHSAAPWAGSPRNHNLPLR